MLNSGALRHPVVKAAITKVLANRLSRSLKGLAQTKGGRQSLVGWTTLRGSGSRLTQDVASRVCVPYAPEYDSLHGAARERNCFEKAGIV
jgi:hypothetical protein